MNLFNFLSTNIIGQLGDQIGTIWLGNIFHSQKYFLLNFYSIEYFRLSKQALSHFLFSDLYNFIYLSLAILIGGVLAYNILTILFLTLNSLSMFLLLKSLKIEKKVSLVFSLFFSIIPYFYIHYEHQTLLVLFPSLLLLKNIFELNINKVEYKKLCIMAFLFALQGLFTLYLFYFLVIYIFIYFALVFYYERKKILLINFSVLMFLTLLIFSIFNIKIIYDYLNPEKTFSVYNFPNKKLSQEVTSFSYDRKKPLNDFIYFSSRPWYFLLPHTTHPIFGLYTKELINYFSEVKDIWIFKNHFPVEHNASFIGFTLLILISYGLLSKSIFKNNLSKKLLILNIFLMILMMPPYIPIGGSGIYTPSYLMYLIFPMFRTTARLAIFVQIDFFIISALLVNNVIFNLSKKKSFFVLIILVLGLSFDFVFSYKYTYIPSYNETSKFLLENNKDKKMVAVYPNSFKNEFLLNMVNHESPFFNPSGFVRSEINFDSAKFTTDLDSCINLNYFKKFNGKYIVVKDYDSFAFKYVNLLDTSFISEREKIVVKSLDNLEKICPEL